jgi:hypothetical protein
MKLVDHCLQKEEELVTELVRVPPQESLGNLEKRYTLEEAEEELGLPQVLLAVQEEGAQALEQTGIQVEILFQ